LRFARRRLRNSQRCTVPPGQAPAGGVLEQLAPQATTRIDHDLHGLELKGKADWGVYVRTAE
jgi:hypothetical protein